LGLLSAHSLADWCIARGTATGNTTPVAYSSRSFLPALGFGVRSDKISPNASVGFHVFHQCFPAPQAESELAVETGALRESVTLQGYLALRPAQRLCLSSSEIGHRPPMFRASIVFWWAHLTRSNSSPRSASPKAGNAAELSGYFDCERVPGWKCYVA
jgi:hypothetical protein